MVVFFRLLIRFLALPFRRPSGILDESVITLRVWPTDLDLNLHMNNGRFLSVMDVGRMDLFARSGLLLPALRRGWFPILGEAKIRFLRPLAPFARFNLRTRILAWDEKWIYMEQIFERSGEIAAVAYVRGLFRGKGGNVAPSDIAALRNHAIASPEPPDVVRRWREDGR